MKKRLVLSLFSILLVSLLFSPYMFSQETPGTVVRVAPRPLLSENDSHRVDIVIENGQAVTGYQIMLQYDSRYIEYVGIDHGNYLSDDAFFGDAQMRDTDPNDSLKAILFAAIAFPNRSEGDGVLATLTFKTIIAEPSDLTLLDRTLLSHEVVDNKVTVSSPQLENSRTHVVEAPDLVIQSFGASLEKNSITLIDLKREITLKPKDVFYLYVSFYNNGAETSDQTRVVYYQVGSKAVYRTKGDFVSLSGNKPVNRRLRRVVPNTPGTYLYHVCVKSVTGESKTGNNCSDIVEITVDHGDTPTEATRLPLRLSSTSDLRSGSLSGEIHTSSDVDYFKVEIPEDGKLTLWTTGDLDTSGELFLLPRSLVEAENGGHGNNFQIQRDVSQGNYYVKVTAIGTGSYTIHASFAPSVRCDRPIVHVIWYYAANEELRNAEFRVDPDSGLLVNDYITPNNVEDHLEDVQKFFNDKVEKTFKFGTAPNNGVVRFIHSNNFFVSNPKVATGAIYRPHSTHFKDDEGTAGDFRDNVWKDIRRNHLITNLKDIYLVLVQSKHGYLGNEAHGPIGIVDTIGGHVAMVALGDFIKEWNNERIKISITHELGHLFGLFHDFSEEGRIMGYNRKEVVSLSFEPNTHDHLDSNWFSERSQNWLKVHPAFNNYSSCNVDTPIEIKVKDASQSSQQPKTLKSYGSFLPDKGSKDDIYVSPSNGKYKIHLDITDLDGLHHVELIAPPLEGSKGCLEGGCGSAHLSLARYLSPNFLDQEGVSGEFSSGHTTWSGTFDITEWMEQEQKRGNDCFDAVIVTIDKTGNRSGFWLWICEASESTASAPSAQKHLRKKTALLPNYPNPFNPETWIPYQLATPADVALKIYDIQGHVVRDLDLGHQRAGMYQSKSRAAYWDGRNTQGESVASGVYFYTLTAGDFTATRKLLIRK